MDSFNYLCLWLALWVHPTLIPATTLEARVQRCDHFVMPILFAHFSPWQDVGTQVSTHGITRGFAHFSPWQDINPE